MPPHRPLPLRLPLSRPFHPLSPLPLPPPQQKTPPGSLLMVLHHTLALIGFQPVDGAKRRLHASPPPSRHSRSGRLSGKTRATPIRRLRRLTGKMPVPLPEHGLEARATVACPVFEMRPYFPPVIFFLQLHPLRICRGMQACKRRSGATKSTVFIRLLTVINRKNYPCKSWPSSR
jgi:hypothetical protein